MYFQFCLNNHFHSSIRNVCSQTGFKQCDPSVNVQCYHCGKLNNSLNLVSNLRTFPRYQPIQTIHIPFESPRSYMTKLKKWFKNATLRQDKQNNPTTSFWAIAAWEKSHIRKLICLKALPNLVFHLYIGKPTQSGKHTGTQTHMWVNPSCQV